MKNVNLILALFVFLVAQNISAQENENPELSKARALMNDYRDASMFESIHPGMFEPSWESIFMDCFQATNIIFDVPVKISSTANTPAGSPLPETSFLADEYLEIVSMERYLEMIRMIFSKFEISRISYQFYESGVDMSGLSSDSTIVFEIEKRFSDTQWSGFDTRKYLYTISFSMGEPKISSVRLSNPGKIKNEVVLILDMPATSQQKAQSSGHPYDVITRIKIDFDENVYDRTLIEKFDSTGRINLGLVSNRAKIIIDSAYGVNREKFSIPSDWRQEGRKVNLQPVGGFRVALRPYSWNGWTHALHLQGGMISQSKNNLTQFRDQMSLKNEQGFGLGGEYLVARFLNPDDWIKRRNNLIYGLGTGLALQYSRFHISGADFHQNAYGFTDRAGDTSLVRFSGANFEETLTSYILKIPVFVTVRKKIAAEFLGMQSISLVAGVNLMMPFQSKYEASGDFSRIGEYPQYNGQVITQDEFYNYYTDREKEYNGDIAYHSFMAEGMIRLNGFFKVDRQNPNNALAIGLIFSFPFTRSSSSQTSEYLINTGEDVYRSLAFSREKIYSHYFGLSVGYNFLNYKVD